MLFHFISNVRPNMRASEHPPKLHLRLVRNISVEAGVTDSYRVYIVPFISLKFALICSLCLSSAIIQTVLSISAFNGLSDKMLVTFFCLLQLPVSGFIICPLYCSVFPEVDKALPVRRK